MFFKVGHQNPFPGHGMDQGAATPWYAALYASDPNTAGHIPALEIGDVFPDGIGNDYMFVHLDAVDPNSPAVISGGALLTPSLDGTDTQAANLTQAGTGLVYGITLVTGGLTPGKEVGGYIFLADLGVWKPIKFNDATHIHWSLKDTTNGPNAYDSDALPSGGGPGGGTNVAINRPGHVKVNATPLLPVGVLVQDQLEGGNCIMQIRGEAMIIGNNSGAALVAGTPAIPAAAGIIEGGTAPSAVQGDCLIVPHYAYDGANMRIPCFFKGAGF